MASQTEVIGDTANQNLNWRPSSPRPNFNQLSAVDGEDRFMPRFDQISSTTMLINFEKTDSSSLGSGQDMLSSWETFESAIIVEAGGLELVIPGPNYSGNSRRDGNDFYFWQPSSSVMSSVNSFRTSYNALSQSVRNATTLTLRDALPFKAVNLAPIQWEFDVPRASVSKNVPRTYRTNLEPTNWKFDIPLVAVLVFTDYLPNIRKVASVKPLVRLRNSVNADGAAVQEMVLDESAVEITVTHEAITYAELLALRQWVKANRTRQIKISGIDGIEYKCILGSSHVPYTPNNLRVNATVKLYGNAV